MGGAIVVGGVEDVTPRWICSCSCDGRLLELLQTTAPKAASVSLLNPARGSLPVSRVYACLQLWLLALRAADSPLR